MYLMPLRSIVREGTVKLNKLITELWHKILEERNNSELLVEITVVLWFSGTPIRALLGRVFGVLGVNYLVRPLVFVLTIAPLIYYIIRIRRCNRLVPFIILYILVITFFALTLELHPEYLPWYTRDTYGVWYTALSPERGAIWAFLMVCLPKDVNRIQRDVLVSGWIWAVYVIFMSVRATLGDGLWEYIDASGNISLRSYSVDFGYSAAYCAIVLLTCSAFRHPRSRAIRNAQTLVGVFAALSAAIYGSRGALLSVLAWGVLLFVIMFFKTFRTRIVATGAIVGGSVLLLLSGFIGYVASFVQEVLGIQSRTLQMLSSNIFLSDNGRGEITTIVLNAISDNPLGYGAYGDRPILGPTYNWGYAHNIFLEFAIDFGVVVGVTISVALIVEVIYHLFCNQDKIVQCLILIFISSSLELLVSNTFWGSERFWALLGLLFIAGLKTPFAAMRNYYCKIRNNHKITL